MSFQLRDRLDTIETNQADMTTLLTEKAYTASVYTKIQCNDTITTQINALIASAPDKLNTLNELAAALNNKERILDPVL